MMRLVTDAGKEIRSAKQYDLKIKTGTKIFRNFISLEISSYFKKTRNKMKWGKKNELFI